MSTRLDKPSASGGTTSHEDEIRELRENAERFAINDAGSAIVARAAADLLEVHDASGISLDNWAGPRNLVNLALTRHTQAGTFTPNGV